MQIQVLNIFFLWWSQPLNLSPLTLLNIIPLLSVHHFLLLSNWVISMHFPYSCMHASKRCFSSLVLIFLMYTWLLCSVQIHIPCGNYGVVTQISLFSHVFGYQPVPESFVCSEFICSILFACCFAEDCAVPCFMVIYACQGYVVYFWLFWPIFVYFLLKIFYLSLSILQLVFTLLLVYLSKFYIPCLNMLSTACRWHSIDATIERTTWERLDGGIYYAMCISVFFV